MGAQVLELTLLDPGGAVVTGTELPSDVRDGGDGGWGLPRIFCPTRRRTVFGVVGSGLLLRGWGSWIGARRTVAGGGVAGVSWESDDRYRGSS